MPKAANTSSRKGTSRADPLSAKGAYANKEAPQDSAETSSNSISNQNDVPFEPASEANYLVQVFMLSTSEPLITRILSVPPNLTFEKLHQPDSMKWPKPVLALRDLSDDDDDDDDDDDFEGGFAFIPKPQSEAAWTLRDVYEREEWIHKAFDAEPGAEPDRLNMRDPEQDLRLGITYEYDLGDCWEHQIVLMGRADAGLHDALGVGSDWPVVCLSGEGHPCAEDCGGTYGWETLKAAFKRNGDKELKDWYKMVCLNGDSKGLNPYLWDIRKVNEQLLRIRP